VCVCVHACVLVELIVLFKGLCSKRISVSAFVCPFAWDFNLLWSAHRLPSPPSSHKHKHVHKGDGELERTEMGAAQQKDASAYFTQALTSAAPPDSAVFLARVKQVERQLCGGAELSGVAQPIAVALLQAATPPQPSSELPLNTTTTASTTVAGGGPHGQLRWLLQLCCRVLRAVLENPNETVDSSTPAVLHLTELLLRHVLQLTKGQSVVLVSMLELGGSDDVSGSRGGAAPPSSSELLKEDAAALLCRLCFAVLIHVPLSQNTVMVQLEVLRLLLTMTSSALHHSTEFREDTMDLFTELMMSSPQLNEFLAVLLRIIVGWGKSEWETQGPLLYHEGCQPSMRNFFQVFGGSGAGTTSGLRRQPVPYVLEVVGASSSAALVGGSLAAGGGGGGGSSSVNPGGAMGLVGSVPKDPASVLLGSCSCWEQLGRHAAALLCVLVVHQKGGGRNPALEYIVSLHDGAPVTFVRLLSAIRWRITRYPEVSILLYVFLHDHHEFLHTVLSEDAALFVSTIQQLLELTYKTCKDASRPAPVGPATTSAVSDRTGIAGVASSPAEDVLRTAVLGRLVYQLRTFSYPFINFMSSTILLLISQDCVVNRLMCSTPCLPGHMLERYDTNAPVGALAVVVLALGITKGFNERNEALIAVFAPCLVNVAPFVHDMDSCTAQRVAGLLTLVLKKIHRASALLKAAEGADTTSDTASHADHPSKDSEVAGAAAELKRPPSSSRVVASAEEAQALEEILAMYLRQLRTIMEGIEALLRGAHRHNEHLIYELLYARNKIIDEVDTAVELNFPSAAVTRHLLMNVTEMIKNCEADIASSDQAQSPQDIIAILRRGQRQGSVAGDMAEGGGVDNARHNGSDGGSGGSAPAIEMTAVPASISASTSAATAAPTSNTGVSRSPGPDGTVQDGASVDLVYSYEESPHSYDFFGPFVWSILLSAARAPGGALWCHCSSELALFPY
jgi:hypothetical protein